jgi:probable rRNA maturation factor
MIRTEKQPEDWEISIVYVNNNEITELNKKHLNKNMATDVISFNLTDELSDNPDGEIYISHEQAKLQAGDYSASLEEEIVRLTVHGVLHLFGYEDDTIDKRNDMTKLENKAIDYFQNHNF